MTGRRSSTGANGVQPIFKGVGLGTLSNRANAARSIPAARDALRAHLEPGRKAVIDEQIATYQALNAGPEIGHQRRQILAAHGALPGSKCVVSIRAGEHRGTHDATLIRHYRSGRIEASYVVRGRVFRAVVDLRDVRITDAVTPPAPVVVVPIVARPVHPCGTCSRSFPSKRSRASHHGHAHRTTQ